MQNDVEKMFGGAEVGAGNMIKPPFAFPSFSTSDLQWSAQQPKEIVSVPASQYANFAHYPRQSLPPNFLQQQQQQQQPPSTPTSPQYDPKLTNFSNNSSHRGVQSEQAPPLPPKGEQQNRFSRLIMRQRELTSSQPTGLLPETIPTLQPPASQSLKPIIPVPNSSNTTSLQSTLIEFPNGPVVPVHSTPPHLSEHLDANDPNFPDLAVPTHQSIEMQRTRASPPPDQQNFVNYNVSSSLFVDSYITSNQFHAPHEDLRVPRSSSWPDSDLDNGLERHSTLSPTSRISLEEKESSTIRCICAYADDDCNIVLCEKCDTWQHIACYYDSAQQIPDIHECVHCLPRAIDSERANERQRILRERLTRGLKRHSRSHGRKIGPSDAARPGRNTSPWKPLLAPHPSEVISIKLSDLKNFGWNVLGTGICYGLAVGPIAKIVVHLDQSQELLITSISKDKSFQTQPNLSIMWTEDNGVAMALEFQEKDGFAKIWNYVNEVQFRLESGIPIFR